jgi:hypothetical protein
MKQTTPLDVPAEPDQHFYSVKSIYIKPGIKIKIEIKMEQKSIVFQNNKKSQKLLTNWLPANAGKWLILVPDFSSTSLYT